MIGLVAHANEVTPAEDAVSTDTTTTFDFRRDIRPLLSDHCFACHGPDEHERQADVRLDTAEGIQEVVDLESWEDSLIVERIRSDDPDAVMPPAHFHKPLSLKAKELVESWVRSGATFEEHWAFVSAQREEIPSSGQPIAERDHASSERPDPDQSKSDKIDRWIDHALSTNGLQPNGSADRYTLARRVAFDLTGLPPTWDDVQSFANDDSPDAYDSFVNKLLQSSEYGEHMGRYWLDVVRYADTHGLHFDNYREMWPYRDWVIKSFNDNKPFDEFFTEQLAGDLLPNASVDQKIASGFNRLNVTTNEGGSIYEEVFARNVIDRTDAFGTVFLGLTTGCAVCHDHKFDPMTQEDYYSLSAFFNSLDGKALDGNKNNHPPFLSLPSDEQTEKLTEVRQELNLLTEEMRGPITEVDAAQVLWQRSLLSQQERLLVVAPIESAKCENGSVTVVDGNQIIVSQPTAKETIEAVLSVPAGQWKSFNLIASTDEKNPRVGLAENGNAVLSEVTIEREDPKTGKWIKIPIDAAIASVQQDDKGFSIEKAIDGKINDSTGWAVGGHQSEGPRTAQFKFSVPVSRLTKEDSQSGKELSQSTRRLRIRMSYRSKYARHILRKVHFRLSAAFIAIPPSQVIGLGDVHVAGPFLVDDAKAGYEQNYANEHQNKFDSNAKIPHNDRDFRWQHRADVLPGLITNLPTSSEQPSVSVVHQTLESPKGQTIDLMIDSDEGHVVFLNGKMIGAKRKAKEFDPLSQSYAMKLNKGTNQLFIRTVRSAGHNRLAYALRSNFAEIPKRLAVKLNDLAEIPINDQTPEQVKSLRTFYRAAYCDSPKWLAMHDMKKGMLKVEKQINDAIPVTLIWQETTKPRDAFILQRGQYDDPGKKVNRETPGFLPPMAESTPRNRLGLAQWLTSPGHPLTARVAVSRFWQQLFGTGLVKTSEDFGSQGTPPSHPELLDELAIDFRESGWDVKALMKRLVMTDAYRRDSPTSTNMLKIDPNNRLLARGPRFRLDAEMLRDQMLAISGLLVKQLGGPSVKPPQPAGLWAAVGYTGSDTDTFVADEGDKTHRRSVYTFWKRTSAPAVMSTFDAPSRESCTVRRERTNTPLQALLLMNEPQTLEASKQLANDLLNSTKDDAARIQALFKTVVLRTPTSAESETLSALSSDLTNFYSNEVDQAKALVGISDAPLAAWTIVANTLLNLDEVVCK